MTDNEIIKALECCRKAQTIGDCQALGCPASTPAGCRYYLGTDEDFEGVLYYEMLKDATALINRQKAEIESLKIAYEKLYDAASAMEKEFAELSSLVVPLDIATGGDTE